MFNRKRELVRRGDWLDPFAMMTRLVPEFADFFGEPAWLALPGREVAGDTTWTPSVDVFDRDNHLVVRVDLPGTKKEEVKVEVARGWLTISGERRRETEEKKESFYRREREYGTFYRAFPLPEEAKAEEVKASFENGVLEVTVPLPQKAEVKRLTVPVEEAAKRAETAKAA